MKIVQSFWTKPFLQSDNLLADARYNGGWPHRILNYYSWALSCLQLCRYYDRVELVTDKLGKEILIDKLQLPYTEVSLALNDLDCYHHGLWSMGKIYTYNMQSEPFLHIDSDVYIGRPFDRDIIEASLVAQNLERRVPGYSRTFKHVVKTFHKIPDYFKPIYEMEFSPSSNAGIIGGNDIGFFRYYTREIFDFMKENEGEITGALKEEGGNLCVILEQVMFYSLARHIGASVTYLLPDADGTPPGIGYFHEAKKNKDYVHCVSFYKNDLTSYSFLELSLLRNYPDYYHRINTLINTCEI